jgi:hypothetical protein
MKCLTVIENIHYIQNIRTAIVEITKRKAGNKKQQKAQLEIHQPNMPKQSNHSLHMQNSSSPCSISFDRAATPECNEFQTPRKSKRENKPQQRPLDLNCCRGR